MTFKLTWLADVLRAAGLAVVEEKGWQSAGRAEFGTPYGVMLHHTAGPKAGDAPSLGVCIHGRPDLSGPLCHLFLSRAGTFHVIAAGRANHAGAGSWQGHTDGNSQFIGIEAENMGTAADPWPEVQMDAYRKGVAALLKHLGLPAAAACGHKEYAPKRKIDPSFDMTAFRAALAKINGA